jgi:nicotinamide-nucleotide amidase
MWPDHLVSLAIEVLEICRQRGVMIATAESCTGGLGVPEDMLTEHGAVSRPVALEMAQGALTRSNAGLAVAVTGVAGPGGGSAEKPVGLVHLAVVDDRGQPRHQEMRYGDIGRRDIRLATVETGLMMLKDAASDRRA